MGTVSFPTVPLPYRFDEEHSKERIEHMLMVVTSDDFSDPHRAANWIKDGDHQRCADHFASNPDGRVWMNDKALLALAAEIGIRDKRTALTIKH